MKSIILICAIAMVLVCGCTKREVYESVQSNMRLECEKLQLPQRDECIDAYSDSFEEYSRKREQALED